MPAAAKIFWRRSPGWADGLGLRPAGAGAPALGAGRTEAWLPVFDVDRGDAEAGLDPVLGAAGRDPVAGLGAAPVLGAGLGAGFPAGLALLLALGFTPNFVSALAPDFDWGLVFRP